MGGLEVCPLGGSLSYPQGPSKKMLHQGTQTFSNISGWKGNILKAIWYSMKKRVARMHVL